MICRRGFIGVADRQSCVYTSCFSRSDQVVIYNERRVTVRLTTRDAAADVAVVYAARAEGDAVSCGHRAAPLIA